MATIAQMLVAVGVDNSGFTRPSAADRERWEKQPRRTRTCAAPSERIRAGSFCQDCGEVRRRALQRVPRTAAQVAFLARAAAWVLGYPEHRTRGLPFR